MSALPQGTVTLLFTDIEGSTRLLERLGDAYGPALEAHHERIRAAAARHGGVEVNDRGDGLFLAFERADDAVAAAADAQQALAELDGVRVRMGAHTGRPREGATGYVGLDVHRAARICDAAHGGQILISETTRELVNGEVLDLGRHRLKDLSRPQRLYQLLVPGLASDFPPLRTLESRPTNLPSLPTSLIGREAEIEKTTGLLREPDIRIVTLTGPGGSGKTRLALQSAVRLVDEFQDGVYFVALETVSDPELLLPTIAQVLSVDETGARTSAEALREFMRGKRVLLVLDNFEQLVDAAPLLNEFVLHTAVKLLVTSRAPLRVSGEHELQVPPLAAADSLALFIERARAVRSDFAVTADNAPAIAEICSRLDGLPLAIELAAARVRLLTPQAMLERLGERLTLLASGPRDVPARQQTLRGAIDWSYDLLGDDERRLFEGLGVFAGGFRIEAAEAVCAARLDDLETLLENSLLRQAEQPDGAPRLFMLETIREYAAGRLRRSDRADLERKHAEYFLSWAEGRVEAWRAGEFGPYLVEAEEQENVRAALAWAAEAGEHELELRLARAMILYWGTSGFLSEGRSALEGALERGRTASELSRARAMVAIGQLALRQGDDAAAAGMAEDALPALERAGDQRLCASALKTLAIAAQRRGDHEESLRLSDRVMAIHRELGNVHGVANELGNQGYQALVTGEHARAEALLREALAVIDRDASEYDLHLSNLGLALCLQGRIEEAKAAFRDALASACGRDDREAVSFGLEGLATVAALGGDDLRAARLWGAAEALFERMGYSMPLVERGLHDELVPASRDRAGERPFDEAWAETKLLPEEQAVQLALASSTSRRKRPR